MGREKGGWMADRHRRVPPMVYVCLKWVCFQPKGKQKPGACPQYHDGQIKWPKSPRLWVKIHSLGRERNLSPSWVCSAEGLLVWFRKCLSPPLLGFLCLLLKSGQVKFKPGFQLRRCIHTSQEKSRAAGRGCQSHTGQCQGQFRRSKAKSSNFKRF